MKKNLILLALLPFLLLVGGCKEKDPIVDKPVEKKPAEAVQAKLNSNVGTESAKAVYFSLSENKSTDVLRNSWDLAFTCDAKQHRVKLNNTKMLIAKALDKNNIEEVTLNDTLAVGPTFSMNFHGPNTIANFDATEGDLNGTVFAEVSENASDNKVYFVVPEEVKGNKAEWYRVKVDRKGNEYTVSYAKLNEKTIKKVTIKKNDKFNAIFFSLVNDKIVNVEPEKGTWDILYTSAMYKTNMTGHGGGTSTTFIPYFMKDLVFINRMNNVEIAKIEKSDALTYENITLDKVSSIQFKKEQDAIADKWRSVFKGLSFDSFYVVKDTKGDYYKLKFLRMGLKDDGGVRGCPEIEFKKLEK